MIRDRSTDHYAGHHRPSFGQISDQLRVSSTYKTRIFSSSMARSRLMVLNSSIVLVMTCYGMVLADAEFFVGFYARSCPMSETIVTRTVTEAFQRDPTVAAGLIRLLFHDCFVEGCDGSILLDMSPQNPTPEKTAGPNLSLRGFDVIDAAKMALEQTCPRVVSCADVLALAARDAVALAGGQNFSMPTGRLDGLVSSADSATIGIVSPDATAAQLTGQFLAQGLSQDEMITLSGAHTIGRTTCKQITQRLYRRTNGSTASNFDPGLDVDYAMQLRELCPPDGRPDALVPLDPVTPDTMDNMYYTNGITGRVLFASDSALFVDRATQSMSSLNSYNGELWEVKFARALVHMASIKVKMGVPDNRSSEIRQFCRHRNDER